MGYGDLLCLRLWSSLRSAGFLRVWDLAVWLMDTCTAQAVPDCGLPAPLVIWGERAAGNPGVRNC